MKRFLAIRFPQEDKTYFADGTGLIEPNCSCWIEVKHSNVSIWH
jgi:hypothetical protein